MTAPVLAIGPANYAGQAYEWAQAVNRHSDASAWAFMRGPVRRRDYGFPSHRVIPPLAFYLALGRGIRSKQLFRSVTHVAMDGYEAFYRRPRANTVLRDARRLRRQGYEVALIAHGTDVRDPVAHMDRLAWSYFKEGPPEWRNKLATNARKNRADARALGAPLFVSTPDLLLDQPEATWLPLSLDVASWAAPDDALTRQRPRVLHLPSRRNPPIKGTQYVDPVMTKLADEGLIEYVSPESVPHREVKALVHSCDIVVDQILTGSYGVAAVEAMAAGRVVVGSLAGDVRARMPETPGLIDADPETLEEVMRALLENRERARAGARENVEFVRRWHDGRASSAALEPYLGLSSSATC